MNTFPFHIEDEDSLVVTVNCTLHEDDYTLVLDTGASNTIIDLAGRTIITGKIVAESIVVSIDELSQGIYFFKIENDYNTVYKIMKQ